MGTKTKKVEGLLVKTHATSVDKFGRPSKLTDAVIEQAWKYLSDTASISPRAGGMIPTKEKLALTLKVSRQTLDNWAGDSSDFLDILNTLEQIQADTLLQHGLLGTYNSTIAKLMLSKHGYIEKSEQDQNINLVQPIVGGLAKAELDEGDEQDS